MNNTQRIRLDSGVTDTDKHLFFKLEQETDTLELLSLKIDTKEAYGSFNADYGMLIGRVTANNGVGIPNAKVSIFIPLDEDDENNSDIVSIYPYKSPRDKNGNVKRYNLLPRVAKRNPNTGEIKPKQPFGSLPVKEEFLANPTHLEVYKKYYKYTTKTNESGDYMIFGVPVGNQTTHMSVDITDIGGFSMSPASMVQNLGYSPNLFSGDGTRIKPENDLEDLPHIETQEISVEVIPFWGDTENFEIGITRQDFRIRARLTETFIIFGSAFTDGDRAMWGNKPIEKGPRALYQIREGSAANLGMVTKRIGQIKEKIYYWDSDITDKQIDDKLVNPIDDMKVLDPSQYTTYKRDGDFVFIINCNRDKKITNEEGKLVDISNDDPNGSFTKFRGFITLEYSIDEIPMNFSNSANLVGSDEVGLNPIRYKLKIPQSASPGDNFEYAVDNEPINTDAWRRQDKIFSGGSYYSVAKFHGCVYNQSENDTINWRFGLGSKGFNNTDLVNWIQVPRGWNTGIILTDATTDPDDENRVFDFPSNVTNLIEPTRPWKYFGGNWLNFSIHLPQVAYADGDGLSNTFRSYHSNTNFTNNPFRTHFYEDNTQDIAAGEINTKWYARSDLHFTDFIEVPITDILNIFDKTDKGFKTDDIGFNLTGKYRNGETFCPINGGHLHGHPTTSIDPEFYFYRGFDTADCISYLISLNLV